MSVSSTLRKSTFGGWSGRPASMFVISAAMSVGQRVSLIVVPNCSRITADVNGMIGDDRIASEPHVVHRGAHHGAELDRALLELPRLLLFPVDVTGRPEPAYAFDGFAIFVTFEERGVLVDATGHVGDELTVANRVVVAGWDAAVATRRNERQ